MRNSSQETTMDRRATLMGDLGRPMQQIEEVQSDLSYPEVTEVGTRIFVGNRRELLQVFGTAAAAAMIPLTEATADDQKPIGEATTENKKSPEEMTEAAKEYMRENLKENREAAAIYKEMLPYILEFVRYAKVEPIVFKCMDGRTQTNDHKGIPPTVATNRRSQGGQTDLRVGNREFWDLLNKERIRAEGDHASLLIITAAHRSDLSSGCAAFRQDEDALLPRHTDQRALEYMHGQALKLRFELGKDAQTADRIGILSGMTNTDTGAMQLYSKDALIFDAEHVISSEEITNPSDVFEGKFLYTPIAEDWAHESIKGKTPQSLLDGEEAPFFNDMRVKIALEAYVMRLVAEGNGKGAGTDIIRHDILKGLQAGLGDFNDDIKAFLTYTMTMNVAYSSHYRNLNTRLQKDDPEELKRRTSHAEKKMAYSLTGHDLEKPNSLLLIKPGSGDEEKSVDIGRKVLTHNLESLKLQNELPPVVHINIELTTPLDTWEKFIEVLGRMRTKVGIVEKVFDDNKTDFRFCTTFSFNQIVPTDEGGVCRVKQFMPLNPLPGNKRIIVEPEYDVGIGITKENFDPKVLRAREEKYTNQDLLK